MMNEKLFRVEHERGDGKEIAVTTPSSELRIYVDNDDVDRGLSIPLLERTLTILNDHWNDPQYAHLVPIDPVIDDDGEGYFQAAQTRADKFFEEFGKR